ncbi:MAG TPA: MT-A70 family methyltransferase [Terracidiphilus sp.]|jgi:N6-adenosine-specific RNA methylase IME4
MTIDPEFRALIAPLQTEERAQLEENLIANGCRDPLVVWRGILIDGHNRHEICRRNQIRFRTVEIALATREHVLLWIEENQLGRRNITDDQRAVIAAGVQKRRAKLAKVERGKQGGRGHKKLPDTVTGNFKHDRSKETRPAVAKMAKVSERKLRTVAEIENKKPAALAAIRAGEKTLLEVKREIKEEERESKREENRQLVQTNAPITVITEGSYKAIVLDPPWDWGDEADADQFGRARPTYATMTIEQLLNLPVGKLAAPNAHIYLWITNRSLPKGFALLERWGFRYITVLTWCKPSIGMGNYFRGSTEQVLFGVRGSLPLLRRDVGTYFQAPRPGEHSTKPPEFYSLVESCSPGPWIEMFARTARPGWAAWGAELEAA